MKKLKLEAAISLFQATFDGRNPTVVSQAPGRVNLIGEHTDYSQGLCLPIAVELSTFCCIGRRPAGSPHEHRIVSQQGDKVITFPVGENAHQEWGRYVAGVAAQYNIDFPIEAAFSSDIPLGGGLSSSAALDVSFAIALEQLIDPARDWDKTKRALLCVKGDHTFVGVQCGIMDQFTSSCASAGCALLIDCRSNTSRLIEIQDPSLCFVVTNTNIKHSHSSGEYGARVQECAEACRILGVEYLRDVSDLQDVETKIKDETIRKRARHVVGENARTLQASDMAIAGDWAGFGELMNRSHASLQNDFQVSCEQADFLTSQARSLPYVLGSRMTGGGFGGCIISLVKLDRASELVDLLRTRYHQEFPELQCTSYIFLKPQNGAAVL